MQRREFLTVLGAATASATPLSVFAQQPAMPVVGILSGTNREPRLVGAIQQGLAEVGYAEGRNLMIEYRFADGQLDRLPALFTDLLARTQCVSASSPA